MFRLSKAWSLAALAGLAIAGGEARAVPSTLTLQGFLTNAAGAAQDGSYTLTVSLWTAETGGSQLYTQTLTGVSVADGLFDVMIGLDPMYPGLGPDIFKNNNAVYMQVELDAGPGVAANEAPLPRRPLAVSPFAFAAHHANSATSATTANTATTAAVANDLNCTTGCVSVSELAFDVATQAELNAALVNVVTTSSLSTTLQGYVTTNGLSTTLQGYVTSTGLSTTLGNYVTSSSLNTTLGNYVTSSSLTSTLAGYVKAADLGDFVDSAELAAALNGYVDNAGLTAALADYINSASLATALDGYVSSSELAGELTNYVTATGLSSALQSYVTSSGLSTTLQGYVTSSGLTSTLQGYVTSSALTSALSSYVTSSGLTSTLQSYVTSASLTSTLQNYVSTSALTTALSSYVTSSALTTALSGYVTSAALTTALSSYVTTSSLNTTLNNYATKASLADYAKTSDVNAALADYAKKTEIPTSVNGMSGGTITSAVTVSGELSATSLKQNGKSVCDTSGNCGTTLTQLTGCTNNQVATFVDGAWKCATVSGGGGSPTEECKGAFKALQWTGTDWACVDVRATGLSTGEANGFEVVDDWGFAWDGIQRGAKTYDEAKTLCESLGARLPLVTELWRNNASTGTGNLGDVSQTTYLWTQVPYGAGTDFYLVRLSDGARSNAVANTTVKQSFRCVWPDYTSDAFDGDYCHGKPGESCQAYGLAWNVDTMDRAPMFYNSAQYECNFHNGSLLEPYQMHDLAQTGWPNPTGNYLWGADLVDWYINYYGFVAYRFQATSRPNWQFDDADDYGISPNYNATYDQNYSQQWSFRCIGKKSATIGKFPASPGCNGGCYDLVKAGRRLKFDSTSRDALNHAQASETCRLLGAALPTANEFTEAVHSGWTANDNSYLWLDEAVYYYGGRYYYPVAGRWDSATAQTDLGRKPGWRWSPEGNTNASRYTLQTHGEDNLFKFRCVWRESLETTFKSCAANQNQVWSNGAYTCVDAVNGTSNGQAIPNGIQIVDAWGNAWDTFQRTAANYATAKSTCETAGGRLPTPTEIYRVRANQTLVSAIGDSTATSYLWTTILDAYDGQMTTVRVSDGSTSRLAVASTTPYRCIWPTTKGDAFTGRSCYGAPADPCFTTGRIRMDRYDRAPITAPAAIQECRFYGGRLAGMEDYMTAIHAGLPNGSQSDVWTTDFAAWYNDGRGYHTARWNGTGTAGFTYQNNSYRTVNVYYGDSFQPFRCVFTDELR